MPMVTSNGISLSYQSQGSGPPVLMIMGSSATGRVWTVHQTPALNRAGYRTVVFDNRGVKPSDVPPGGYTLQEMAADTAGLIQALDLGPCRVVGTSLGAAIAQELAVVRPDLVRCAVLIATRSRSDAFRRALSRADLELAAWSGAGAPAGYAAVMSVLPMLSPATLDDDVAVQAWLDTFELAGGGPPGRGQAAVDTGADLRGRLAEITVPCRVIAFEDDLVCPPHLAAEVAEAIKDCDLVRVRNAGHLGFLERPAEVNTAIIEFLDEH